MDKAIYFDGHYYEMRYLALFPPLYFTFGFSSSGESLVYMLTGGAVLVKRSAMTDMGNVRLGWKLSLSI